MSVQRTMNRVQDEIILEMIKSLENNEPYRKLERKVHEILRKHRRKLNSSLWEEYEDAESLMREHLEDQWGIEKSYAEVDPKAVDKLASNLNNYVLMAMLSTGVRASSLERQYARLRSKLRAREESEELLGIYLLELQNGLESLFVDSRGYRWKVDRYTNHVTNRLYGEVYGNMMSEALEENNVRLVRINAFSEPREACANLQGKIVCIVPREQATTEEQAYPNVWDPEHRIYEMGGHHGADGNCRHAWLSVGSSSLAADLYGNMDRSRQELHYGRQRREKLIKQAVEE